MKRLKKIVRRIVFILSLILVSLIPVPIFVEKKEGKFNNENTVELTITQEKDSEEEGENISQELKF